MSITNLQTENLTLVPKTRKDVQALKHYAFSSGKVRVVRAHTRPEPNASTRVLTKCGFLNAGKANDPEDGSVWRWEVQRDQEASLGNIKLSESAKLKAMSERSGARPAGLP